MYICFKIFKYDKRRVFELSIIENIFAHQFREVSRNTWKNSEGIIIEKVPCQKMSFTQKEIKSIMECEDIPLNRRVLVNSLFSVYMTGIDRLSENTFSIPCNKKDRRRYHFTCFEIKI